MAIKVGVVSQKGGVGKSTLARTLGVEFARAEWEVLIADMDTSQSTSFAWNTRRLKNGIVPNVAIQQFHAVDKVLKSESIYDLIIFDGAPHATRATEQIALISDLIVLPTGGAKDDLDPQITLAHELRKAGVNRDKIVFVLSRMGNNDAEINDVKEYVELAGYKVLDGKFQEKTSYRQALDLGKALTETKFKSLNKNAKKITLCIADFINALNK